MSISDVKPGFLTDRQNEIDLFGLLLILWRKRMLLIVIAVTCTLAASLLAVQLTPRWTSEALIVPPLFSELQAQEPLQEQLSSLGVVVPLGSDTWFALFIEFFDAPLMQQKWQEEAGIDPRFTLSFTRESSQSIKNKSLQGGYRYEKLTVTASDRFMARRALKEYMAFVSRAVSHELNVRVSQTVMSHLAQPHAGKMTGLKLFPLAVQPYRLQEAPTLTTVRSSVKPSLLIALGFMLGLLIGSMFIVLHDAWSAYIRSSGDSEEV